MYLGHTSLIYASRGGHIDVVKVLLDYDADIHANDTVGKLSYVYLLHLLHVFKMLIHFSQNI